MRFRLPLRRTAFVIAAFAFSVVALLPMRVAAGLFGAEGRGLAAREAAGSVWLGVLKEAQFGRVPLGDLRARLNVLPLFLGRARLSLSRADQQGAFEGALTVSRHGFGLDDLSGQLRVGGLFGPLPLASLDMRDVSVHFAGGLCESAEGQVRATLSGEMAGIVLPAGLLGEARCADGALLLALAGQSAMDRAEIRIFGDGRYRADVIVRPADAAAAQRLAAAGFAPGAGGYVRRLDGSF